MLKLKNNLILLFAIVIGIGIYSCGVETSTEISKTSFSGYTVGLSAIYGDTSLIANGSSQATVKVEVWNAAGNAVNNAAVTLTATLGSLASSSLTTTNGTAITTFTSGTTPGNAAVTATVENVSATVVISLARF